MAVRGNAISKTFIWILLALLIVGLAGFGATSLGGNIRTVGAVGDKQISVDLYARTLQEDLRAISAQAGQNVPFSTAQALGVDRQALARVVTSRALDHETAQLGLSVGDAQLQQQILSMSAFQGINGSFDREAYRFTLENAGLSEAAFEDSLREEAARTLVQGAILSGTTVPSSFADTIVAYIGERRNASVARLKAADLAAPVGEPTEAQLTTWSTALRTRRVQRKRSLKQAAAPSMPWSRIAALRLLTWILAILRRTRLATLAKRSSRLKQAMLSARSQATLALRCSASTAFSRRKPLHSKRRARSSGMSLPQIVPAALSKRK